MDDNTTTSYLCLDQCGCLPSHMQACAVLFELECDAAVSFIHGNIDADFIQLNFDARETIAYIYMYNTHVLLRAQYLPLMLYMDLPSSLLNHICISVMVLFLMLHLQAGICLFSSATACSGKCDSSSFNSVGPLVVGSNRYWWLSHHLLHSTISTEVY